MKKYLLAATLCATSFIANAETFIGGLAGFAYSNEIFTMSFAPCIGYEFNDKFAIGSYGGVSVYEGDAYGLINPFLRITPCQNDRIAFDLKIQSNIEVNEGEALSINGISPCLRAKISNKLEIASDFGIFGFQCYGGECTPSVSLKNVNVNATIIYKLGNKSK